MKQSISTPVKAALIGLLAASGAGIAVGSAHATTVVCGSQSFQTGNGGRAFANNCSHNEVREVRLAANCDLSPNYAYSPYQGGPFKGVNFSTNSCTFGVDSSEFQHR
ncbi:hypothetical protein ACTQ49_00735 [Luteococcus sp. Sow4_B9]|uniref:hypothetical protein n=1 Tax=Luteococcus sp. Sow4_B9 TaxID=3438792 RepID=UPI003F984E01